jgi:hypothetical protein
LRAVPTRPTASQNRSAAGYDLIVKIWTF